MKLHQWVTEALGWVHVPCIPATHLATVCYDILDVLLLEHPQEVARALPCRLCSHIDHASEHRSLLEVGGTRHNDEPSQVTSAA